MEKKSYELEKEYFRCESYTLQKAIFPFKVSIGQHLLHTIQAKKYKFEFV